MQDLWFGDNLDLLKWGSLVTLAQREGVRWIFQVGFLRAGERPEVYQDGEARKFPDSVWQTFRSPETIQSLSAPRSGLPPRRPAPLADAALRCAGRCALKTGGVQSYFPAGTPVVHGRDVRRRIPELVLREADAGGYGISALALSHSVRSRPFFNSSL